jgi:hypothetical protein
MSTCAKRRGRAGFKFSIVSSSDHHTEYLRKTVAALSPEGHRRVDELLEQLAQAAGRHDWLVRFAKAREAEADSGDVTAPPVEPTRKLTDEELDGLIAGFMTIRDTEQLDDVADWANAVLALITDERDRGLLG